MKEETPWLEYLIIGSHTCTWLVLLLAALFDIQLTGSRVPDAGLVVVVLPFAYLIGMIVDDAVHKILDPMRRAIRDQILDATLYKDELLAYRSERLYEAYESRMRRVRILGTAIFNWPLLGAAALAHVGFARWVPSLTIVAICGLLSVGSYLGCRSLYRRAYLFRKNACDCIFSEESCRLAGAARSNGSRAAGSANPQPG
ncbi:MAG: hypothetical protein FJ291_08415 [Planctomycetes bacterium]|nr:hypothetical protein [Planctomycetota bacterium]